MANNLFLSYDLRDPGQDYENVIKVIKAQGSWAKIHQSYWYINSNFTAEQVATKVWSVMDDNDSLMVVDCSNNDAYWYGISDNVTKHLQKNWTL